MAMKVKVGSNESNDIKYKSSSDATAAEVKQIKIDGTIKYAKNYTITFTAPTYGYWDNATKEAFFGDTLVASGKKIYCYEFGTSQERWVNEVHQNATDAQYTYSVGNASVTSGTSPVAGNVTIPKPNSDRSERSYNVTFSVTMSPTANPAYAAWDPDANAVSAPYSAAVSLSGTTVTVNGTSKTFYTEEDDDQYAYTASVSGASGTVGTGKAIVGTATRTVKKYKMTITGGDGISSVFLSTSSPNTTAHTPTSGDASNAVSYNYGTKVYGYVVLAKYYNAVAGWTLVSATGNTEGAIYCIGNKTIGTSNSLSAGNAVRKTVKLKISKGTGVQKAYYRAGTSGDWTEYTAGDTGITVNAGSTYQWKRTPSKHYHCDETAQTANIELSDYPVSATATVNTYTLSGTFTYGSVVWYSDSNYSTQITSATYGSTVYYKLNGNTGYNNGTSGHIDLTDSNFTIAGGAAAPANNSTAVHDFGTASNKTFTLSLSVTGSDYGNYSVTRTPTKAGAPAASTVGNNGTIYYGDTLTYSASAKDTRYGDWGHSTADFKVCTGSWNGGDCLSPSITVTSQCTNNPEAYLYVWDDTYGSNPDNRWRYLTSFGTNGATYTLNSLSNGTGLAFSASYTFHVAGNRYRSYWTRSMTDSGTVSGSYDSNNGVTGNVTISFGFSEASSAQTESQWVADSPSTVSISTGTRNSYTITWKYLTAYADTWNSSKQTVYYYGDTPGTSTKVSGDDPPTPSTVSSGTSRKWYDGWDSLATVTASRTITATYTDQVNVTELNGSNCTANIGLGWINAGTTITWTTTDSNLYGFSSSGKTTTTTTVNGGSNSAATSYVKVTSVNGTRATAYTNTNYNVAFSTGWKLNTTTIYWKITTTGYCFNQANNAQTTSATVVAGNNDNTTDLKCRYTISISTSGTSYGSYSVKRGSTTLSNNDYIYYGDVITFTHSANGQSSTNWGDWTASPSNPSKDSSTGEATSGNLTVKNNDSAACTIYYQTASSGYSGTSMGSANSGATVSKTGLSFNTTYYVYATKGRSRNGTYYTYNDNCSSSGTLNGVNGDVSITVSFSADSHSTSESGTGYSSLVSMTTAARASYTITFENPSFGYWSSSTKTAYWGQYIYCYNGGNYCALFQGTSASGNYEWTNAINASTSYRGASAWCTSDYGQQVTGNLTVYASSSATNYTVRYNYPSYADNQIKHTNGQATYNSYTAGSFNVDLGTFTGRYASSYTYTLSISYYLNYYGTAGINLHTTTVNSGYKWTAYLTLPSGYYSTLDCYYSGTETYVSSCNCGSTGNRTTTCNTATCIKGPGQCNGVSSLTNTTCTTLARMGAY